MTAADAEHPHDPPRVGLGYEHVVRLGTFVVDHDSAELEALDRRTAVAAAR